MAEPLSFAASLVSIIVVSAQTVQTCYKIYQFYEGMKGAPESIRALTRELESLDPLLKKLQRLALDNSQMHSIQILIKKNGMLEECKKIIEGILWTLDNSLQKMMRKSGVKVFKAKTEQFLWFFREEDIMKQVRQITRIKETFSFALSLDTASSSEQTLKCSQEINTRVQDMLEEARNHAQLQQQLLLSISDSLAGEKAREKRKAILEWFFPGDFSKKHQVISDDRQSGTGTWLLNQLKFRNWSSGQPGFGLLLGLGIAGAGKTYLSSAVIDHLQECNENRENGVAYIYFTYTDSDEQQSPRQILRSLIKQLIHQLREDLPLPPDVTALYDQLGNERKLPTERQLYKTLVPISKLFLNTLFVFDALDECHKSCRQGVLKQIHQMSKDGFCIFATSRQLQDVRDSLPGAVRITLSARKEDVEAYLQAKIRELGFDAQAQLIQDHQDEVISEIVECAGDMFLLARFYFKFVCGQHNRKELTEALRKLRHSGGTAEALNVCYQRVITSIKASSSAKLAFSVLSWLLNAKRSLRARELEEALAIQPGLYSLNEDNITPAKTLVAVCAGLVEIDTHSGTFAFTHATIPEYLSTINGYTSPVYANFKIATACMTYLCFKPFAQGPCSSPELLEDRLGAYPFFWYAARYLLDHEVINWPPSSTDMFSRFLENQNTIDSFLQAHHRSEYSWNRYPKASRPLHVASMLGNVTVLPLVAGEDLQSEDENGQQPLHWAAKYGHLEIVRFLLDHGALASPTDKLQETPLHIAAKRGYLAIAEMLLERGADIHCENDMRETPLFLASGKGHPEVVALFLSRGADLSRANSAKLTPLSVAKSRGRTAVVKVLCDWKPDPSKMGNVTGPSRTEKRRTVSDPIGCWRTYATSRNISALSGPATDNRKVESANFAEEGDQSGYGQLRQRAVATYESGAPTDKSKSTPRESAKYQDSGTSTQRHLEPVSSPESPENLPSTSSKKTSSPRVVSLLREARRRNSSAQLSHRKEAPLSSTIETRVTPPIIEADNTIIQSQPLLTANPQTTDRSIGILPQAATIDTRLETRQLLPDQVTGLPRSNESGPLHLSPYEKPQTDIQYTSSDIDIQTTSGSGTAYEMSTVLPPSPPRWSIIPQRERPGPVPPPIPAYSGPVTVYHPTPEVVKPPSVSRSLSTRQTPPTHVIARHSTVSGHVPPHIESYRRHVDVSIYNRNQVDSCSFGGSKKSSQPATFDQSTGVVQPSHCDIKIQPHSEVHCGHTQRPTIPPCNDTQPAISAEHRQKLLHTAVFEGNFDAVHFHLSGGGNPQGADELGRTLLHVAAYYGHVAVAGLLLSQGADLACLDDSGRTPLHLAVSYGHTELAQLLLTGGANPSTLDSAGQTSLHIAANGGHAELARVLLDNGANPAATDPYGRTPLRLAKSWATSDPAKYGEIITILRRSVMRSLPAELPAYNTAHLQMNQFDRYK